MIDQTIDQTIERLHKRQRWRNAMVAATATAAIILLVQ
jgi:hypothetical protein